MSVFSKLRGTIESIFQVGINGPNLKGNAGALEARNAADSNFAVMRGAAPVGNNDLATKTYVDTLSSRTIVSLQWDGGVALPANTGTEQFYVVTTTGGFASIGQLLWDDGTGVGTATVLAAVDGRLIITTQAFVGGTIALMAESLYAWDAGTSSWLNVGNPSMSGAIRAIRYAINTAATQDSASQIPANAVILRARVTVTVPFSGGATATVGRAGSLSLLQTTTDNHLQTAHTWEVPQETSWGGAALAVRTTIAGAPGAGAGFVTVEFSVPDA
jgi:hypothetical protein